MAHPAVPVGTLLFTRQSKHEHEIGETPVGIMKFILTLAQQRREYEMDILEIERLTEEMNHKRIVVMMIMEMAEIHRVCDQNVLKKMRIKNEIVIFRSTVMIRTITE